MAPILMTALTVGLALIPLVLAGHESGNEIQSPMAQDLPPRPVVVYFPQPGDRAGAVRCEKSIGISPFSTALKSSFTSCRADAHSGPAPLVSR